MTVSNIPVISVVAALLPDMGIGFQGTLPWRLSKEMKYFKQVTTNTFDSSKCNAVIMGRKTWESIPKRFRPLPNRLNVVISRSFTEHLVAESFNVENSLNYYKINSIQGAIRELNRAHPNLERIYIIGGGEIYESAFDFIDHWLITKLEISRNDEQSMIPSMDTFLNKEKLIKQFQQKSKTELSRFLPPSVELPDSAEDDEKGYHFEYTLYTRR